MMEKSVQRDLSSGRGTSIDDLPNELLTKILSYIPISGLINVTQHVCARWKELSHALEVWKNKGYIIKPRTDDGEIVKTLKEMPQLTSIKMDRPVDSSVFHTLINCHNLTELMMHFAQGLDCHMVEKLVEQCPNIKSLTFPSELLEDDGVPEAVGRLSRLRELRLFGDVDPTVGLQALADGCPMLHSLDLNDNRCISEDLEYFLKAKKRSLQHLTVRWSTSDKRCVVPLLAVCASTLQFLHLTCNDEEFTDGSANVFAMLNSLPNLRELIVRATDSCLPGSPSLAFKPGNLCHLEKLDMKYSEMTNETALAICKGCPNLSVLLLGDNYEINDEGLAEIHCLSKLKILELSRCRELTGATMSLIAQLPVLHTLVLDHLDLTKFLPGLEHVLTMNSLRRLGLDDSIIPPEPFDKISENGFSVRYIYMQCCFPDDSTLKKLLQRIPHLQVYKKALDCQFYNPCAIPRAKIWSSFTVS